MVEIKYICGLFLFKTLFHRIELALLFNLAKQPEFGEKSRLLEVIAKMFLFYSENQSSTLNVLPMNMKRKL